MEVIWGSNLFRIGSVLLTILLLSGFTSGLSAKEVEGISKGQKLNKIDDFSSISKLSLDENIPIVILIEQSGCRFCKIVRKEFIQPLSLSKKYRDRVIFRKISLDSGETLLDEKQQKLTTAAFCERYDSSFTPTLLFVDGNGNRLHENLVGLSSKDYYGYYLEQAIEKSLNKLKEISVNNI